MHRAYGIALLKVMATSYKFTGYAFGKFVKEDQWAVALEQTHERKRRVAYLLQQ